MELVAPREIRLRRNSTENRLRHKASKRDIALSNQRLIQDDEQYRLESLEGEISFENYLKIDTSNLGPQAVARQIKAYFKL